MTYDFIPDLTTGDLAVTPAEHARVRRERDELRAALSNSDSLLRALGTPDDPVVQTALVENAKALANLNKPVSGE